MTPRSLSRRRALQLGALGAAGVVVGATGLSRTGLPWSSAPAEAPADPSSATRLVEPVTLSSDGGRLSVDLALAERAVEVGGRPARMLTYNGGVPGPTLRLQPGDELTVRLVNGLDSPTNLHTHGLHVSPRGNGDNALLSIAAGETFDYRFWLPDDHPTGVFWYHPHRHGFVADQVFGGLYGAIVVGGDDIPVERERMLVVSDVSLGADGSVRQSTPADRMLGREGDLLLVNGQRQPVLEARPGERERWRVVNACTSRYLRLAVRGQSLQLVGIDGGHEPRPRPVDDVLLAPGSRADLIITMREGTGDVATLGYDRGSPMMGGMRGMGGRATLSGPATLATLAVTGTPAAEPAAVPRRAPDSDLRDRPITGRRVITFTMGMGGGMGMSFGFDGRVFDPDRVDQRVRTGDIEEWTIRNPTPMDHPFHLHVWPMQVIEQDGAPVAAPMWRDVVNVPAGGRVRGLVEFSRFPGRTVYHCHILDHEDAGMMGIIEAAA